MRVQQLLREIQNNSLNVIKINVHGNFRKEKIKQTGVELNETLPSFWDAVMVVCGGNICPINITTDKKGNRKQTANNH